MYVSINFLNIFLCKVTINLTWNCFISQSTPSVEDPAAKIEVDSDKQTVISEADSTEPIKTVNNNSDTLKVSFFF